jgi:hypothetical protein
MSLLCNLCSNFLQTMTFFVDRIQRRRMASSGMLRRVALVRTDISKERIASIIRETRIAELGTTLAITSNRSTLRRNVIFCIELTRRLWTHLTKEGET